VLLFPHVGYHRNAEAQPVPPAHADDGPSKGGREEGDARDGKSGCIFRSIF